MTDEYIVGKTPEGFLTIEMGLVRKTGLGFTIEHEEAREVLRFSASGGVWPRLTSKDIVQGGQCLDLLWEAKPASPWTETDLCSLWAVWKRWHLNDMRMACAHQFVLHESSLGYDRPDLERTNPCPATGYKLGSAWLYEPIPEVVLGEIRRLQALLVSGSRWEKVA